jgi:hypothetical protein
MGKVLAKIEFVKINLQRPDSTERRTGIDITAPPS